MQRYCDTFPTFSAVYAVLPPMDRTQEPTVSCPFAIAFSFSGHEAALLEYPSGRTATRRVRPNAGGMTSGEAPAWVEIPERSEFVEFRPNEALRRSICDELGVPQAAELAEIGGIMDPVLWAASARFRAHALGGWPLEGLEAESLMETLVRRLVSTRLGGKPARASGVTLDRRRLDRVTDYIEANLSADLSIEALARVAALSRYHFIRAFKATTGLTPHSFVLAMRMQRARALLAATDLPVGAVARQVGYADAHSFRRAFLRHFGRAPGQARER